MLVCCSQIFAYYSAKDNWDSSVVFWGLCFAISCLYCFVFYSVRGLFQHTSVSSAPPFSLFLTPYSMRANFKLSTLGFIFQSFFIYSLEKSWNLSWRELPLVECCTTGPTGKQDITITHLILKYFLVILMGKLRHNSCRNLWMHKRFIKKSIILWFYYEDLSISISGALGLNRRFEIFQKQKNFFEFEQILGPHTGYAKERNFISYLRFL
jgi:hypothetical protein